MSHFVKKCPVVLESFFTEFICVIFPGKVLIQKDS